MLRQWLHLFDISAVYAWKLWRGYQKIHDSFLEIILLITNIEYLWKLNAAVIIKKENEFKILGPSKFQVSYEDCECEQQNVCQVS